MTAVRFPDDKMFITANPMTTVYGVTEGEKCGGCRFLFYFGGSSHRFYKCEKRKVTHGAATDHRVGWPACGLFEPKPNGEVA